MKPNILTEQDATTSYARAWNTLNCEEFLELLADNCHYASQYVFEELESKERIREYLVGKMQTVRKSAANVRTKVGKIKSPDPDRPCVLMYQGDGDQVAEVIVFEVVDGRVQRYDLCMPGLFEFEKAGNKSKVINDI